MTKIDCVNLHCPKCGIKGYMEVHVIDPQVQIFCERCQKFWDLAWLFERIIELSEVVDSLTSWMSDFGKSQTPDSDKPSGGSLEQQR